MILFLRIVAGIAYSMMCGMLGMLLTSSVKDDTAYFIIWPIFGIWGTLAIAAAAILSEMRHGRRMWLEFVITKDRLTSR